MKLASDEPRIRSPKLHSGHADICVERKSNLYEW